MKLTGLGTFILIGTSIRRPNSPDASTLGLRQPTRNLQASVTKWTRIFAGRLRLTRLSTPRIRPPSATGMS